MQNREMSKTPFWSFGYQKLEESRVKTLHHRSPEATKCETPKRRSDSILEFRILGVGSVETLHHRNTEMQKTPFGAGFRYRELECRKTSPQEYRNVGMPKCEKHLLV
jgi:hypothetical protein